MRRFSKNAPTFSLLAALAFSTACSVSIGSGAGDSKAPGTAKPNSGAQSVPKANSGSDAKPADTTPADAGSDASSDTPAEPQSGTNTEAQPGRAAPNAEAQPGKSSPTEVLPAPDLDGTAGDKSTATPSRKAQQTSTSLTAKPN